MNYFRGIYKRHGEEEGVGSAKSLMYCKSKLNVNYKAKMPDVNEKMSILAEIGNKK
jgi:hypothetical protein